MARFPRSLVTRLKKVLAPLREAGPISWGIDGDEHKWRPLTSRGSKELSPLTYERALNIAYYLYTTNPLAHRVIEITKDFVVGEGISFQADDPEVQAVLMEFWQDPVNQWDLKQHNKALELSLYGEQCYPAFVNPQNGRVRLGYLDPLDIKDVVTDPENCEVVQAVVVKGLGGRSPKRLQVIGPDEDPASATYGRLRGDCFYFAINKVSNAARGRSDLLALIDWIDAYDQFLFSRAERANLLNAFVWDIKLEGFNEEQIQTWIKNNPTPKPGSIRAHNEKVEWRALAPVLNAQDASEEARLIKNHILGGAGLPEHWFAEGGNANRATAAEMGEPTIKRLSTRQRYFRHMIEYIFGFVLDQAVLASRLSPRNSLKFSVTFPEISVRDMAKAATTLEQVAGALSLAERNLWVSRATARHLFATVAAHLGVEIDPRAEANELRVESGELRGKSSNNNSELSTFNSQLIREFAAKETGLKPEKRQQRLEAVARASTKLAIELYKGKGNLTRLYERHFRQVITVDKDPMARADYLMDNSQFLAQELDQYLDFTYVDFDAWGSPGPLIQQFFAQIKGKKATPFVLALTDGAIIAARMRGEINLYQYYLLGPDEVTKATSETYEKFEEIIRKFVHKVARINGFSANEINMVRNSLGTAIYAAYEINPH